MTAATHAAPGAALDERRRFLEALLGDVPGWIDLRFITPDADPARSTERVPVESIDAALARVAREDGTRNVYVGIATRRSGSRGEGAGGKANLAVVRVLWVDVDFDPANPEGDREVFLKTLASFPLAPSMIVWTGGGMHVYWILKEPEALDQAADVERFEATLWGLCDYLGGDSNATDASRILRVPGTMNLPDAKKREKGRTTAPCVLGELDLERTYTLDDFEPFTLRGEAKRAEPREYARAPWDGKLPARVQRVLEAAAPGSTLARRWRGDAEGLHDASDSGLDFAFGCALAARLPHDEELGAEIEAAIRVRRVNAGARAKHDGYYRFTVEKILGAVRGGAMGASGAVHDEPAQGAPSEREAFALTDYGNGERLAARHGADLRYVFAWSKWLVFDGVRFEPDDQGAAWRRAKETARAIYAEAAAAEDADERKRVATWAKTSESEVRLRAMLELAKSEPGIPVRHDELDADPWLLAVRNGVVDLRTGELRSAARADLLTKLAPVVFDASAKAPTWRAFLERIVPDEKVRAFLQRAVGYSLTGDTREHALFLLHGSGANGKSTFIETLLAAVGDYGLKTPADTLLARRDTGVPNDVARMRGARVVAACETEDGRRLAEVRVKELTGGDTVSARFMRAEWFDFRPVAKLWLSTNHRPSVRGTDEGIWRRIRLIPFAVVIPEEERDRTLPDRLRGELPGVLTWAVEGCLGWQVDGLEAPAAVREATAAYRDGEDVLAAFLEERCRLDPQHWTASKGLYEAYRAWCETTGEKPVTKKRLGDALRERGFESARSTSGAARGWWGIALPPESSP